MRLIPANAQISRYTVAEHLLENGVTMIHLLRDRKGVVIPESLNTRVVRLNFSYRYGIADFCVDEKGIRASLSFQGIPQFCDIPWTAVCGMSSGVTDEFLMWVDIFEKEEIAQFMPPELVDEFWETRNMSLLDEMPELKPYAVEDTPAEEDDEEEVDDDDMPPGGYTPLRFV